MYDLYEINDIMYINLVKLAQCWRGFNISSKSEDIGGKWNEIRCRKAKYGRCNYRTNDA